MTKQHANLKPAARSIVSNFTQFCRAKSTFSCMTSLTVSTFLVTEANLSTSDKLSYFWHIFCNKLPHVLSRELSFAVTAFSPAFAENYGMNLVVVRELITHINIFVSPYTNIFFASSDFILWWSYHLLVNLLTVRWSSSKHIWAHRCG